RRVYENRPQPPARSDAPRRLPPGQLPGNRLAAGRDRQPHGHRGNAPAQNGRKGAARLLRPGLLPGHGQPEPAENAPSRGQNRLAEQVKACLERDRQLVDEYHAIDGGRWFGMGLSEHIGFTRWNEDECRYPAVMNVLPVRKPRLLVALDGTDRWSEGSSWHVNRLTLTDFRRPDVTEASFTIYALGDREADYEIACDAPWLALSSVKGTLDGVAKAAETVTVAIDRGRMGGETEARITVTL